MSDQFGDLEVPIGANFAPFIASFEQFNSKMQTVMRGQANKGQANAFSKMLYSPNSKAATKKSFDSSLGGAVQSMSSMMKGLAANPAARKGVGSGFFKNALDDVKRLKKEMPGLKRELNALAKDIKVAGRGPASRGARAVGRGAVRGGKWAAGKVARVGLRAAGFLGQSTMGFVTGAYRQGIEAWQQTAASQLEGGPQMVGMTGKYGKRGAQYKAQRYNWGAGQKMGYNAAEGAQIQSAAAKAGMGGPGSATNAFAISRSMGAQGLEWGGGLMRRQGLTGGKGSDKAVRQLSQAMAIGVKTGLTEARLPELLQAANDYAEQQIAVTPDKGQYMNFMKEMGRFQLMGGAGMKGKYGAAAGMRADQAIKGAQGVQQSFLLRAFGFGKGTGLVDALKRQETGFAGTGPDGKSNMMTIMEQLRQEYGSGKGGGLSEQGQLAFKGMGLGSLGMAQKFSNIYLKQQKGEMTSAEAKKRVSKIQDQEKESKMPAVQLKAYRVMAAFGGTSKILSALFNKFAGFGAKEGMAFKKEIVAAQIKAVNAIKPLFKSLIPLAKTSLGIVIQVLPKVISVLGKVFDGLHLLIKIVMAFIQGTSKTGSIGGGWSAAKKYMEDMGNLDRKDKAKSFSSKRLSEYSSASSKFLGKYRKQYSSLGVDGLDTMRRYHDARIAKYGEAARDADTEESRLKYRGMELEHKIGKKVIIELQLALKSKKLKVRKKPAVKNQPNG